MYSIILLMFLGMLIGSFFDTGTRAEGNLRGDLPSTIGIIVGAAVGILLFLVI